MPDTYDDPEEDNNIAPLRAIAPQPLSAPEALGLEALKQALTRKTRILFAQPSHVIIVRVPNAEWLEPVGKAIIKGFSQVVVKTAGDTVRTKTSEHRVGRDTLSHLQTRRTVAFVSQDPDAILDETVLAAADVTIVIAPPTPVLLRKVIRRVCKSSADGIVSEMASLPLPTLLSAIRPGVSARTCVSNLHRAVEVSRGRPAPMVPGGPGLAELPLTATVRAWTDQTLVDLATVRTGSLAPDRLMFGVFEGAPGTGKTLVAQCLARSAGWAFEDAEHQAIWSKRPSSDGCEVHERLIGPSANRSG